MRGTRIEIRPGALRNNARRARILADGAEVFAMIKADGYGHGLTLAADALAGEVDGFGVAVLEEARALREHGISAPILVAEGFFDREELEQARALSLEMVVHSPWQVALLQDNPGPLRLWLKLNTGMNRLGLRPDIALEAAEQLAAASMNPVGVMSHFACADEADEGRTDPQMALAGEVADRLGLPLSAANSAALIRYPHTRAQRVRPGIMLYGSSPFDWQSAAQLDLAVSHRFSARLIAINEIQPGDTVGYGATWTATRPGRIGVVAAGYGDGYPRHAPSGTPAAVNGQLTMLVGRVSMDMLTIDLHGIEADIGDEVELWGDHVDVDKVARACGTISYELFCQITGRPERVIV
ncbi:alanine racemase [Alcanivorax jadensis T9]|jgi:alanine racemase|uniref:Alanine racemase n=1 Tax=Alcanivorax jadensis T9 TaxID=1177181 RepID=A0ABR4WFI5_9GAMM|nr:alanine racemase [Alcanivorax jadensis]KGD62328.1 alanine racemase [Alcanivorax jadensis T9]MDF1636257.1 alanine racemase [Alcanivorax jadensis]